MQTNKRIEEIYHIIPSDRTAIYKGKIISHRQVLVHPRKYIYAITDVTVQTNIGPRVLFLSFKCGLSLYRYLNTNGRTSRINSIYFEFQANEDRQMVDSFSCADSYGWVKDAQFIDI